MKKLIAVYDADTRYAERLSDYVNRKEKGVFTAQAFTSKEKLAEYAKKHEIDVLLSGERTDSGDISGIPSAQKIYMSEETEKQMDSGKEIYKFQSGDDIILPTVRFRGSGPILLELWGSPGGSSESTRPSEDAGRHAWR